MSSRKKTADPSQKKIKKCSSCHTALKKIDYKIWGTKVFDPSTGSYLEDEALGSSDIEYTCPDCTAKLDPEGLVY